jgi:hypothetical protein
LDRKQLEEVMIQFLSNGSDQKVMLLKGDWGVGKSYFIEGFLEQWGQNKKQSIGITSLFGISDFKHCLDRLHFPAKTKTSLLKNGLQFINKYRKIIPSSIPTGIGINVNLDQIFQTILSTILKDGILVIDDIERKNKSLSLEEVLGATSYLAEKHLRKAILVFSESNLSPDDKKAIRELREKTVDIECTFNPSSRENAALILTNEKQIDIISDLNITNIRLIRKIKVAWNLLIEDSQFKTEFIKNDVSRSVAVLSIIHLTKDKFPFKIDDLIDHTWLYNKDIDSRTAYSNALKELRYNFDERELPIINYLKTGQFDPTKWQTNIDSFEANHQSQSFRNDIMAIWKAFHGNFKTSYNEVIKRFSGFLNEHCEEMYPSQIMEMFKLFDNIGFGYEGNSWLEKSIIKNIKLIGIQELQLLHDKVSDASIISLIAHEIDEKSNKADLESALKKVVFEHSWTQEDTHVIQNATIDEYKSFIENSKDGELLSFLGDAYKLLSGFTEEGYKNSARQLKGAAYKIVDESIEVDRKLNDARVRTFFGPRD